MTAYRTPDPAAELAALRAEVAALRAASERVPMRYVVRPGWQPLALMIAVNTASAALWVVVRPWSLWRALDIACAVVSVTAWALAFVRRVPAEGARS